VLKRITKLTLEYRWHFTASAVFAFTTAVTSLFIPKLLGQGVDDAIALIEGRNASRGEIE
jgi:ABC-type multidrug transport system fused ATPase/permease subunit